MEYYTQLLGMWKELYSLSPLDVDRSEKVKWFENLCSYQFFTGLDDALVSIRTQIVNMNPLPNIDSVYAMVVQRNPTDRSPHIMMTLLWASSLIMTARPQIVSPLLLSLSMTQLHLDDLGAPTTIESGILKIIATPNLASLPYYVTIVEANQGMTLSGLQRPLLLDSSSRLQLVGS